MATLTLVQVTPIAGGELFSGMILTVTSRAMYHYGLSVSIQDDHRRQILLNLICFVCGSVSCVCYALNATKSSIILADVLSFCIFLCVQYGLVILNHNTIIRASILFGSLGLNRQKLNTLCTQLYLLPFIVLIPIYYSIDNTNPSSELMISSSFNSKYYKPLNIFLIIITEFLASITDILLLKKIRRPLVSKGSHSQNLPSKQKEGQVSDASPASDAASVPVSGELLMGYTLIWFMILVDITIKVLIFCGFPLLFDTIITCFTICLRANVNLTYGLELSKSSTLAADKNVKAKQQSMTEPPIAFSVVQN